MIYFYTGQGAQSCSDHVTVSQDVFLHYDEHTASFRVGNPVRITCYHEFSQMRRRWTFGGPCSHRQGFFNHPLGFQDVQKLSSYSSLF